MLRKVVGQDAHRPGRVLELAERWCRIVSATSSRSSVKDLSRPLPPERGRRRLEPRHRRRYSGAVAPMSAVEPYAR